MIRNKLLYAVLLVIMLLFWILYRGKLSQELLMVALVFPLILLAVPVRLKRSVRAAIRHGKKPIHSGDVYHWVIVVQNRSIFSTGNAIAALEYRNSFDGTLHKLDVTIPILPKNTQRIHVAFHAPTCGVTQIWLRRISIYDPLCLFHRNLSAVAEDAAVILPKETELIPPDWQPQPQPDADTTEYSKEKAGDDPSEIFDLHSYREGDPVSRIHWKLSSKLDTLMVKEYSLPLSADCILLPDFRFTCAQPEAAIRIDRMCACFSAATEWLSQHEVPFRIGFYNAGVGIGMTDPMKEPGDAAAWIFDMMQRVPLDKADGPAFFNALVDLLSGAKPHARVMLFLPQEEKALTEALLSLPAPERITAVVVCDETEPLPMQNTPFTVIPAPEDLSELAEFLPDSDDESVDDGTDWYDTLPAKGGDEIV